jgi:hypothetical protein
LALRAFFATTTALTALVAEPLPAAFEAVTVARRRKPTSAEVTEYEEAVPEVVVQFAPVESQRCHA